MNILITGGTGFVGNHLINRLKDNHQSISALVRSANSINFIGVKEIVADVTDAGSLSAATTGMDVVIHCAGRAHVMKEEASDPLSAYRQVNTEGTLELAAAAASSGVKRFVFISSIKVSGEATKPGNAFIETQPPMPEDPYGKSKHEAEQGLLDMAKTNQMEVVIIRPPLVYGPGVKGNFATMATWVQRGIPLPFGAVHNARSMVAIDNLTSFIAHCADPSASPKAANETFLISDGNDISTAALLRNVGDAYGRSARLIPVPVVLMLWAAKLVGKSGLASRLLGNLQIDSTKARVLLNWEPVTTMQEQLKSMIKEGT